MTRGSASGKRTTSTSSDPVERYARSVLAGEIVAGPLVRAACRRHLDDLKHGPARGLVWRLDKALRAIEFFPDVLRLPDVEKDAVSGEDVIRFEDAEPFNLALWQQFIVGSIFGWYNADRTRRFRVAYAEVGKGNGKTPLAAGIGLYMQNADGQAKAECYAAAAIKDQAKVQYRDAVYMVQASDELQERIEMHGEKEVYNLVNRKTGSFYKPISAEKRGLDGKRVHYAGIDEVHEHTNALVCDKMRAGTKGRRNALIFEITNSGVDRTSICYQHHEYSERVVMSEEPIADSWFAYVCGMDEGDDPMVDEACWIKANPNLGVSIEKRYLRDLVVGARGMPANASIVKRLNFCIWVDADNPALDQDIWRRAASAFDLEEFPDVEPVGALDLSGIRDLTAAAIGWPGEIMHAAVEFWTPKEGLLDRAKRDRVPYDLWVEQGHIKTTPGRAINYRWVAIRMGELQAELGLNRWAFDPYRIKYLEEDLDDEGIELTLIPHGQGFYKSAESGLWMPRSIELLEDRLDKGTIKVKPNPALNFAAASAVHETDPKANRIFTKQRSRGRIDGVVALAMLVGLADAGDDAIPAGYVPAVA